MNNPNTQLKDLIHIEKNIIPADICEYIVNEIEKKEWEPHFWYNYTSDSFSAEKTKELDIQRTTPELQNLLTPYMIRAGAVYNAKYHFDCERTEQIMNKFSLIRFNRYSPGQTMRQHHDHIHSLFDGKEKGIPVLSFIINFNDGYEGSELYFWDDYKVNLGKGDIIMFPSLFLFPHGVTEAISGKRYSGVSWAW